MPSRTKTSKKPASKGKAVVSASKKHRSFRLTPKSFALFIVVAATFSTVGVLGYNKVQYGSYTASASWSGLVAWKRPTGYIRLQACKISTGGARWYVMNQTSYPISVSSGGTTFKVPAKSNSYSRTTYSTNTYVNPGGYGNVKVWSRGDLAYC